MAGRPLPPISSRSLSRAPGRLIGEVVTKQTSGPVDFDYNFLDVRLNTSAIVRLVDQVTNSFRQQKFYNALAEANRVGARAVQEGMVEELQRRVAVTGRKQRGGERLEKAIMHDKNTNVNPNNFTVGIESWLNQSPAALYWRRIEEGDQNKFDAAILFTDVASDGGYGPITAKKGSFYAPGHGSGHMRMKQFNGAFSGTDGVYVRGIGPFPAYQYSLGGQRAITPGLGLDMADVYIEHLRQAGYAVDKGKSSYFK